MLGWCLSQAPLQELPTDKVTSFQPIWMKLNLILFKNKIDLQSEATLNYTVSGIFIDTHGKDVWKSFKYNV